MCIFRYYYKKYYGTLGRELTNNEPSSSHKNKPGHSHGIDLPSVHDTDAHINMGGIINHAGSASNGSDCISDVHTYSTISTVTNFDSTHHMPLQHIKISTDSQEESTGDAAIPPFGSSTIWQGDGVSMKKNESYRQTMAIHSIRNPSYGTNIAIAPWIDTKDNVAYKAAIDFDLHLETQV